MARIRSRSWRRAGFTLIEMVIVLSIILLLAALLMAGVMKVMGVAPEVQARTELSQMEIALNAFMADYSLSNPPPSYLMLREDLAYNLNPANPLYQLELQSFTFLNKVFTKNLGAGGTGIDWNGDGQIEKGPPGMYILEGEECLVFYLSGIPNTWERAQGLTTDLRGLGFSTNNSNPAADTGLLFAHTGAGSRKGPYYSIPANRLVTGNLIPGTISQPFYVFVDPWKKAGLPGAAVRLLQLERGQ